MAENKTVPTDQGVEDFLNRIEDEQKRNDSFTLLKLMREVTGLEPQMWGSSVVGFGSYHYKYASGREGDTMLVGFSPRKQNLTIYNMGGIDPDDDRFKNLGKHTTGKGCLYIRRLADVDEGELEAMAGEAWAREREISDGC